MKPLKILALIVIMLMTMQVVLGAGLPPPPTPPSFDAGGSDNGESASDTDTSKQTTEQSGEQAEEENTETQARNQQSEESDSSTNQNERGVNNPENLMFSIWGLIILILTLTAIAVLVYVIWKSVREDMRSPSSFTEYDQQVKDYLKNCRTIGKPKEKVAEELSSTGWTEQDIEELLEYY